MQRALALAEVLGKAQFLITPGLPTYLSQIGISTSQMLPGPNYIRPEASVVLDTLHHGNVEATTRIVKWLKARGNFVAVIDSMPPDHLPADRVEVSPDLLITPYINSEQLRPAPVCKWLAGPKFAILRSGFLEARKRILQTRGIRDNHAQEVEKEKAILVACGGVDPTNLSTRIVRACIKGTHPVHVIVGPQFETKTVNELSRLSAKYKQVKLHKNIFNLEELYLRSALVVGRPGLLRYEAAVLGRMAVYLWESSAYVNYFRAFADKGLAEIYFDNQEGVLEFMGRISALACSHSLPKVPLQLPMAEVDGRGAIRIAEVLSELGHSRVN